MCGRHINPAFTALDIPACIKNKTNLLGAWHGRRREYERNARLFCLCRAELDGILRRDLSKGE